MSLENGQESKQLHKKLTVGDCFAGIGGLSLGLEWTGGFETRWQIENDEYATRVLEKHWPNVQRYQDIRSVNPSGLERVDLICGGYPCQPFSLAGKRGGKNDPRHLWPDMLRIIREIRPRFALLENVPGHLSMGFGEVLGDLAECGYDAEWGVLSAAGVGAPQIRRRLFLLAYSQRLRRREPAELTSEEREPFRSEVGKKGAFQPGPGAQNVPNTARIGQRQGDSDPGRSAERARTARERSRPSNGDWWKAEPDVDRVVTGVPSHVDRLRCLGNAVVPQVAEKVGRMILEHFAGVGKMVRIK